jgi:LysR family carnitine catabolism transcriptional activator
MIDFTSRQLRAFLLAAQHRSFTRAAGALFITPSGLSLLIKELENQLGIRLFERTTRHITLTAAGADLFTAVQRNLQELDDALSRSGRPPGESAALSLGAPPFWASGLVAQALTKFRKLRPEFRLRVFDGDSGTTLKKVESGELDMGLGFFFRHLPGIRRTLLFRTSFMVIRANAGNSSRRASLAWSALKGERFVTVQPNVPMQQLVDKHLAKAGVVYQPDLVVNHLHTLIAMVEAGMGIAIVPFFAFPECHRRGLAMSRLVNPAVNYDFYQIRKGERKLPAAAEEFTSFLKDYIAAWARNTDSLGHQRAGSPSPKSEV